MSGLLDNAVTRHDARPHASSHPIRRGCYSGGILQEVTCDLGVLVTPNIAWDLAGVFMPARRQTPPFAVCSWRAGRWYWGYRCRAVDGTIEEYGNGETRGLRVVC